VLYLNFSALIRKSQYHHEFAMEIGVNNVLVRQKSGLPGEGKTTSNFLRQRD